MNKLLDYFQDEHHALRALNRYLEFADESNWNIGGYHSKLHLYNFASRAFDRSTSKEEDFESFRDMYGVVKQWPGVQRGGSLAPAEQVFEVLFQRGSKYFFRKGVDLSNFTYPSSEASNLRDLLPKLSFIKNTKTYPWMAVSKVLHFMNPGLFPIWDFEVIWNSVMGTGSAFQIEYKKFCRRFNFTYSDNTPIFLLNYILWAAGYIQQSHEDFMEWFEDWMNHHFADDVKKFGLNHNLKDYFAVAFEFVAIGAAHLEKGT
jgi:hypothetical protein